jgi:hypothetical protein
MKAKGIARLQVTFPNGAGGEVDAIQILDDLVNGQLCGKQRAGAAYLEPNLALEVRTVLISLRQLHATVFVRDEHAFDGLRQMSFNDLAQ